MRDTDGPPRPKVTVSMPRECAADAEPIAAAMFTYYDKNMNPLDMQPGHRWLCGVVRAGALLGAAMSVVLPAMFWSDAARLAEWAPQLAGLPCDGIAVVTESVRWMAAAVSVLPVALAIAFFAIVWRLFGEYRAGRALTLPALRLLQRLAWVLLALVVAQPLVRAAMSVALTAANPPGQRHLVLGLGSNDYLGLIVALTLLAIATVMRQAVGAAEENRAFV